MQTETSTFDTWQGPYSFVRDKLEAKDLRIGNWVDDAEGHGYTKPGFVKVESISGDGINHWQDMGASGYVNFENIYPIPLTPEILEKCGYKQYGNKRLWKWGFPYVNHNGKTDIRQSKFDDGFYSLSQVIDYENGKNELKYLHQLQNLYFALTGEELQITLV